MADMDSYIFRQAMTRAKGPGWLGTLKRPDGGVSTELSIGVGLGGAEVDIPSLIRGLTDEEIAWLLADLPMTDEIAGLASEHAMQRLSRGRSPFAYGR